MSWYPTDELLELVRTAPSAAAGWPRVLAFCRECWPEGAWQDLPDVATARDVAAAAAWLTTVRAAPDVPSPLRGLYLGLDTLNMDDPGGKNVEIGGTATVNPADDGREWLYALEWYGPPHLIESLRDLQDVYMEWPSDDLQMTADYVLFLTYSGLVLAEAAAQVTWRDDTVVVWGFHDGDLYTLGQGRPTGFERLVTT